MLRFKFLGRSVTHLHLNYSRIEFYLKLKKRKEKCFNRNCEISMLGLGPMLNLFFGFEFWLQIP